MYKVIFSYICIVRIQLSCRILYVYSPLCDTMSVLLVLLYDIDASINTTTLVWRSRNIYIFTLSNICTFVYF